MKEPSYVKHVAKITVKLSCKFLKYCPVNNEYLSKQALDMAVVSGLHATYVAYADKRYNCASGLIAQLNKRNGDKYQAFYYAMRDKFVDICGIDYENHILNDSERLDLTDCVAMTVSEILLWDKTVENEFLKLCRNYGSNMKYFNFLYRDDCWTRERKEQARMLDKDNSYNSLRAFRRFIDGK